MFKNMKLTTKLIVAFLAVGVIPALVIGLLAINKASSELKDQAFNQLVAVRDIKKHQIENYIQDSLASVEILSKSRDTSELYAALSKYHDKMHTAANEPYDVTTDEYHEIWKKYGRNIAAYQKSSGFYDVFIICASHGHVMYTACKENDIGTNLTYGPYKESGLAKVFRKIVATKDKAIVDFEPYAPSNGDPAAFAGVPIYIDGKLKGAMVVQLSIDKFNEIMQERSGMGKTGETYLVGQDRLMRSDSFLDPKGHSVKASFAGTVQNNGVDTKAATEALDGNTGAEIVIDYNGNPVLSAFTPVEFYGLKWALLAEIDKAEAFAAINMLRWLMLAVIAVTIGIIIVVAILITRSIAKPILKGVDFAKTMAGGDLTHTLDIDQVDEVGILAKALNEMNGNLRKMFKDIGVGVQTLSASSTELASVSNQMSSGAENTSTKSNAVATASEEMSSNMNSVAAAMEQATTNIGVVSSSTEQMTASINEIAQNTERASMVTRQAVTEAQSASAKVNELGRAADEIGKVTEAITEISEQTNLLALNATIEAARAGSAGKGFAVVANEIKELASQTAEATKEIRTKIEGIQVSTSETVTEIENITNVIGEINDFVSTIASAVEEQSVTTKEIAANVVQTSQGLAEVNRNVAQTSTVAGGIAKDIAGVNHASSDVASGSEQVNTSAVELSKLSERLNEMVCQFNV